jgi:hypothetical protein
MLLQRVCKARYSYTLLTLPILDERVSEATVSLFSTMNEHMHRIEARAGRSKDARPI